jgi:predicted Zn-dependent protease
MAFSPDRTRLAVGFGGGLVHLLDAETGDALLELHPAPPEACAIGFGADGSDLIGVSSGTPGGIIVFETGSRIQHAEARAVQARARVLVDGLRDRLHFAEEIALAAAAAPDEPAEVRLAAARLARARGDQPNYLNGDAWAVVRFPNRSAAEYTLALARAERACHLRPEDHAFSNTLGVAQLRAGRLDEAIETLTRCMQVARADGDPPHPIDLLPLAVARAKSGDADAARGLVEGARASAASGRYPPDPEYDWFLAEAEGLISGQHPAK